MKSTAKKCIVIETKCNHVVYRPVAVYNTTQRIAITTTGNAISFITILGCQQAKKAQVYCFSNEQKR